MSSLGEKRARLHHILREQGPTLVAYSGGVDSACLAFEAWQVMGNDMLAVIADSPSLPRRHLAAALRLAERQGIPCEVIRTQELQNPDYQRNDERRCFFCKDELFRQMESEMSRRPRFRALAYGVNVDDRGDFRPGHQAAAQHGVTAPLLQAGLGKAEVRELARQAGLEVWDRPASACLSSRVAYGTAVTPEILRRIEAGEEILEELGFRQFRVRYHGEIARIEIARPELPRALDLEMADRLTERFRTLGFRYVTLDLQGYRTGSMNEVLAPELISASSLMAAGRN